MCAPARGPARCAPAQALPPSPAPHAERTPACSATRQLLNAQRFYRSCSWLNRCLASGLSYHAVHGTRTVAAGVECAPALHSFKNVDLLRIDTGRCCHRPIFCMPRQPFPGQKKALMPQALKCAVSASAALCETQKSLHTALPSSHARASTQLAAESSRWACLDDQVQQLRGMVAPNGYDSMSFASS